MIKGEQETLGDIIIISHGADFFERIIESNIMLG
jgi:hypothetical protein